MTDSTSSTIFSSSIKPNQKGAWISTKVKYATNKPMFVVLGYNGGPIVEEVLTRMGWKKAFDKNTDDYAIKWTEVLAQVNFYRIKPTQLVNHIPNCGILTNKLGLLLSLRGYEKYCKSIDRQKKLHMDDFIPTTYVIDDLNERVEFYKQFQDNDIWICKPVGANQGKGISLIRNIHKFKSEMLDRENTAKQLYSVQARIVQKYITNPLLIYGKKFDIRSYMLIASTIPYVVLFCPGYVRLSMNTYSNTDENLITHLTNQFVQKKSPKYNVCKEDTVMSMDGFNSYYNRHCRHFKNFKENWVNNELTDRMKDIVYHVFKSIKQRLANSTSFFELYGLDFMIDEEFKVWLIEANSNPSMSTQCSVLHRTIPPIVEESLKIVIECFEKNTISNKPILPIDTMKLFQEIYIEEGPITKSRRNANTSLKSWTAPRFYYSTHQETWLPDTPTDNSDLTQSPNDSLSTRLLKSNSPKRFPVNEKFFEKVQHKNSFSGVNSSIRSQSSKPTASNSQRSSVNKLSSSSHGRSLTTPRSFISNHLTRQSTDQTPINITGDINSSKQNALHQSSKKVSTASQTDIVTHFIKDFQKPTTESEKNDTEKPIEHKYQEHTIKHNPTVQSLVNEELMNKHLTSVTQDKMKEILKNSTA